MKGYTSSILGRWFHIGRLGVPHWCPVVAAHQHAVARHRLPKLGGLGALVDFSPRGFLLHR
jgi:hypothetical protein